jgi:hypothetical protein
VKSGELPEGPKGRRGPKRRGSVFGGLGHIANRAEPQNGARCIAVLRARERPP